MVDLAIASTFARELTEEQFGSTEDRRGGPARNRRGAFTEDRRGPAENWRGGRAENRPGDFTEERPVRRRGLVGRVFTRLAGVRG